MGRTGSECSLFFYLVVFMGCSQNWGEGSFTEKDKGFRRRELCVLGDKGKMNLKDLRA